MFNKEEAQESSNQDSDSEEEQVSLGSEQWTRVMNLQQIKSPVPPVFRVGHDLIFDKSEREALTVEESDWSAMVFSPKQFLSEAGELDLADRRLSEAEMLRFAHIAIDLRQRYTRLALSMQLEKSDVRLD